MPPHSAALSFDIDNEQGRHLEYSSRAGRGKRPEEEPEFLDPGRRAGQRSERAGTGRRSCPASPKRRKPKGGTQWTTADRHAPAAHGDLERTSRATPASSRVLRTMGTLAGFDSQFDAAHAQQGGQPDALAGYLDCYPDRLAASSA